MPTCTENVCYPPGEEENSYILGYDPEKVGGKGVERMKIILIFYNFEGESCDKVVTDVC